MQTKMIHKYTTRGSGENPMGGLEKSCCNRLLCAITKNAQQISTYLIPYRKFKNSHNNKNEREKRVFDMCINNYCVSGSDFLQLVPSLLVMKLIKKTMTLTTMKKWQLPEKEMTKTKVSTLLVSHLIAKIKLVRQRCLNNSYSMGI